MQLALNNLAKVQRCSQLFNRLMPGFVTYTVWAPLVVSCIFGKGCREREKKGIAFEIEHLNNSRDYHVYRSYKGYFLTSADDRTDVPPFSLAKRQVDFHILGILLFCTSMYAHISM